MKKIPYFLSVLAITFCVSCTHNHDSHDHEHEHAESAEHHDHDHGDEDHEHNDDEHGEHSHEDHHHADGEINLSPDRAAELGVVVDTLRLQPIDQVITVTGEVISDPANQGVIAAPVAGRVTFTSTVKEGTHVGKGQKIASISGAGFSGGDANQAAQIELEAAKKELDRIKPLRDEGIVTAAEYNAALQNYQRARNAIGQQGGAAVAPMSGVITAVNVANGQYVDAGQAIAEVAANGRLTVRADVPKRYASVSSKAQNATVRLPYTDQTLPATLASQPSDAAATSAYQPVYYNVASSNELSPGSYVEIYLIVGKGQPGLRVPISSVTERLGRKFVYVKDAPDCYERRPVTVGTTDGKYIEITSGLQPGEVVVTEGTTFVRLAETSNVAPPGHTHSH